MKRGRVASYGAGLALCMGNWGLYTCQLPYGDACSQTFVRICAISHGPCQFVGLMYASFTQSWACDPQRQHPALQKRLLSLVSVAPRCCTGTLAALCFVIGSLLGSALGESRWSPELMDFTQPGPTLHKKITDVMPPNVDFAGPFVFLCVPPRFLRNFIGILVLPPGCMFFGYWSSSRSKETTASAWAPVARLNL